MTILKNLAAVLVVSLVALSQTLAQSDHQESGSDEKSEAIIRRAIESVGGQTYLDIRTVIGRGFYTTYQEGLPQLPTRFLDYLSYPDSERTEFTSNGVRIIQTNSGETGWTYDGATRKIADMKPAQIQNFKISMRTSFENLLRGWWRKEGGTVKYVGRREAGLAMRNETIRLTYPDGFWIEFEFGARDGKPAKIIYKRTRQREDTEELEEIVEEDRLAKLISIQGVAAPWVIDHFRNGFQTSRVNYESVEYNRPLAPSLFAKPENPKDLKK
ncbi:MAG TPA: hypothetical protein VJ023_19340 [Pyrinomonadaceae bacterium]|nr:hypothetical protein [Pyrinomonadaceae bacterium]